MDILRVERTCAAVCPSFQELPVWDSGLEVTLGVNPYTLLVCATRVWFQLEGDRSRIEKMRSNVPFSSGGLQFVEVTAEPLMQPRVPMALSSPPKKWARCKQTTVLQHV